MKQLMAYSILKDRFFKLGEVTSYFSSVIKNEKGVDNSTIEEFMWDYKEYKEGALPEC